MLLPQTPAAGDAKLQLRHGLHQGSVTCIRATRAILPCVDNYARHACSRSLTSFSDQALSPVPCPPMTTTLPPTAVALQQPIAFILSWHIFFSFQLQLVQMQIAVSLPQAETHTALLTQA